MTFIIFAMMIIGFAMLLMSWLPRVIRERSLTLPMIYVGFGLLIFSIPTNDLFGFNINAPNPLDFPDVAEHLTELAVILSLTGGGLRLTRVPSVLNWGTALRLLAITMPLCIILIAFLGWWLAGLALPAAVLLGAVLAPTDPVLADEVQVESPHSKEDEVRFSLTLEAGLNDGLAFPFTYLAIALVAITAGDVSMGAGLGEWLAVDFFYRIIVGIIGGLLIGRGLAHFIFNRSADSVLAEHNEGLIAIAITLIAYSLTEIVNGYGFLAVFFAAVTIRQYEADHEYHERMHVFGEQIDRMMLVLLMILLGGALIGGVLDALTWQGVIVVLITLLIIRPVTGMLALIGSRVPYYKRPIIAFFGIRGIGSFYYLAYGLNQAAFGEAEALWAIVSLVVLLSIIIHGITVTPVMRRLDA